MRVPVRVGSGGVALVAAGQRGEEQRRVADRARHRAGGVHRLGDGDDAAAAHQPDRRLHPDEAVDRRGRDDRAVGLGADGQGREARGDRRPGAGARTAGVAVEGVRVLRQPAARAPAAGRARRADVRPLGEIRLAEDHRARRAQPGDEVRVTRRLAAQQCQRAGGGLHRVGGGDVVLQQHRNPVQRPAGPFLRGAPCRARSRVPARPGSLR